MTESQTELTDILVLLLQKLSEDETFNMSTYLTKFKKCETNLQRMNFIYKDMERVNAFPPFKKDKKDDVIAVMHRVTGNEMFKAGNYRKAMDRYTLSAVYAKNKELLALAFANRSAALFNLGLHQECVIDIARALENGYPDDLKPKLIARRNKSEAKKTVKDKSYEPVPKFPDSEKNLQIQCARNCVKISKNEQYGRHVVATRNIEIGEILVVESPYSAIIKCEMFTRCHECFEVCYNMIPCAKCTRALYCSEKCKDKAFAAYHKYQCPILLSVDLILADYSKRIALKTMFLSKKEWDKNANAADEQDDDVYRSDRLKEMCLLETHADKRDAQKLLAKTAVACGVLHLVKTNTDFFKECGNEERFKEILLQTLLAFNVNGVDINEISPNFLDGPEVNSFAVAFYPFFALFNHSCWPNVSRHFHGSSMVLRAIRTIKKGEQCFVCYGPSLCEPKLFRQNFLRENQFFICTCQACKEDWSLRGVTNDLPHDLRMLEYFTGMQLVHADVNVAKRELQRLLVEAKNAERNLPPGRDFIVKDLLMLCYNIFGNKRRL